MKEPTANIKDYIAKTVTIQWARPRGRFLHEYSRQNTCTLSDHRGNKVEYSGKGYDMLGTLFANWMTATFPNELRALKEEDMPQDLPKNKTRRCFEGLSFYDPNFDAAKAIGSTTSQTSKLADPFHTEPHIEGEGVSSVLQILRTIGLDPELVRQSKTLDVYVIQAAKERNRVGNEF